jgi:CMP/dCMP kinase
MSTKPAGRSRPVIAIDGPAGAGKSTVASHLARKFGLLNLETGAMYRALALKAIQNDADLDSEAELMALAAGTRIVLEPQLGGNRVLLDGVAVSQRLREPDVTAAASRVSVHPRVRHWMVEQQRALGAKGGVVMEGRDIGTVVFPDAEVKIFLDAAPEVRGNRRYRQTEPAGAQETEAAVLKELRERDARDRNRAESPLRPAEDATVLDTTHLGLPEVLERVDALVQQWVGNVQLPLA